jgi:hypothetical protein
MDRPSRVPIKLGSMLGCDGGAAAGGRVLGSVPWESLPNDSVSVVTLVGS